MDSRHSQHRRLGALVLCVFLVSGNALAHIHLDGPNGGEILSAGSTVTITWTVLIAHPVQNWDIWYSATGPNGPWIPIVMDLPVTGSAAAGTTHTYVWTVPANATSMARVRVRQDNLGTSYEDVSDADFTIVDPALAATPSSISVNTGGSQVFTLHAGSSHAGMAYLLAGSLTGTTPGFMVGGLLVPLEPDPWLDFCIAYPNVPPLVNTLGTLDASGAASAALVLPPGLPLSLAGMTAWHTYVVAAPGTPLSLVFASEPVPLMLVP